jgi:hypothetical protein
MFACTLCAERFTVDDVKQGKYFISTNTCLACYQKMYKSKLRCFGKDKMFDPSTIACSECPDERICRTYIKHRKEF